MKRRSVTIFSAGFLAGLLMLSMFYGGIFSEGEASSSTANDAGTEAVLTTSGTSVQPAYPSWEKSAVYNGGDFAEYHGKIYRAKWWTVGELPDAADVWEDTGQSAQPSSQKDQSATAAGNAVGTEDSKVGKTTKQDEFKVVGYYPSWKTLQREKLRFDVLTHIVYAFAIPTEDGGLRPLENADAAKKMIAEAHQNNVKVLLAVGGWSYHDTPLEGTFVSATSTVEKSRKFADAIVSMCDQYGFDGVDMDWEHPRIDGGSGKQYERLMLDLSKRLHEKGKLLTSAVMSGVTADGNVYYDAAAHSSQVLAAVDWIHVMAYDGGDGERHSSYQFAVNSGNYWHVTRKLPSDKVVLGVPFYGRPSWASYEELLAADPNAWNLNDIRYQGMDVFYNGVPAIREKTRFAKQNLGGVMIWELTQDTTIESRSLVSEIGRVVNE